MAHECWTCGHICYCDCDDIVFDEAPLNCRCQAQHDREAELPPDDDDDAGRAEK
jgi:hypothetical protein